jgi:hypothetical protein
VGVNTLEIKGHPSVELYLDVNEPPVLITVCSNCGHMRTILFLNKDRWMCFKCKTEGSAPPNMYPIK